MKYKTTKQSVHYLMNKSHYDLVHFLSEKFNYSYSQMLQELIEIAVHHLEQYGVFQRDEFINFVWKNWLTEYEVEKVVLYFKNNTFQEYDFIQDRNVEIETDEVVKIELYSTNGAILTRHLDNVKTIDCLVQKYLPTKDKLNNE